MKKYGALFIAAMLVFFLLGCDGEKTVREVGKEKKTESFDFLIVTQEGGIEEQTAKMVAEELENMGYTSKLTTRTDKKDEKEVKCVIFVGVDKATNTEVPSARCSFEINGETDESTLSPCISSGTMARAATLLLPKAKHFTVFFEEEGGRDVQEACDVFDLCGVDYRAERVEMGEFSQCFSMPAKWGSDAVLLPSSRLSGEGVEIYAQDCAVFAVGEGETVRGALATFCIDTESLATDTARLAISKLTKKDPSLRSENYYILCLNRTLCERYEADVTAVSEDFSVIMVD